MPRTTGLRVIHQRRCKTKLSKGCTCSPSYQARVWVPAEKREIRRNFGTEAEARAFRDDGRVAVRRGTLTSAAHGTTIREAGDLLLAGMEDGSVRNRGGEPYKPSVVRGYRQALVTHVYPNLGAVKMADLRRRHVQALADRLVGLGLEGSTVRNALMPLRVICRRARRNEVITLDPTSDLDLPAPGRRRDRVVTPGEARLLLQALPVADQALWATALYAGLRRGELLALLWQDIDLTKSVIHVRRSWDMKAGTVEPKSRAGRRTVPIPTALRAPLTAHKVATGNRDGLVFRSGRGSHFDPSTVFARARKAWAAASLPGIGLHEARHTYASLMIAAGVNANALKVYMGHSSITVTLDRYGHLFPGNETEAASLLDAFLEDHSNRVVPGA